MIDTLCAPPSPAAYFGVSLFIVPCLSAGMGKRKDCHGQDDDGCHTCKRQRNAGRLRGAVISLHIESGENQSGGEGIGGKQETALKEQNAISEKECQKRTAEIGSPHLTEDQNDGHTNQTGVEGGNHCLHALLYKGG